MREHTMAKIILLVTTLALTACGADVASTAANAALIKKQELEQGKKTMDMAQQKIDQSMIQMQQNTERADDSANK
jgi:curli biogenesis system outer membrane secretion channel CsgG